MKVKDLFFLYQGNNFELLNMSQSADSQINFVSRTGKNNGIVAKVDSLDVEPFKKGLITVALGGSVLSAFVQPENFYTAFHIMVLKPKAAMSLEQKLFYCLAISRNSYRYSYGRQANKTLPDIELPDMSECDKLIDKSKVNVLKTSIEKKEILFDVNTWKEFKLSDLFTQERGKEKAPNQNDDGDVLLINETDDNNGATRKVTSTKTFKANAITISINFAKNVFFQEKDFCASVNISIIKNKNLNRYNGLFIISILRKLYQKYSYGFKISKNKIDNTIIKLPVTESGTPDWLYMEKYIKSLPYSDSI